jgi:hypothetical protein
MTTPKIIKVEKSENGNSYQIDFGDNMVLWFDLYKDADGELTGDWNKYIFGVHNEQDQKEKAFQEANSDEAGAYNYMTALELCEEYQNSLDRLEEIRAELIAERISYGELAELASLKDYIDPSDVQLLEAASVPEFPDNDDTN